MILKLIAAHTGYYVGFGIEAAIAITALVLLILLLTGFGVKKYKQLAAPQEAVLIPLTTEDNVELLNAESETAAEEEISEPQPAEAAEEVVLVEEPVEEVVEEQPVEEPAEEPFDDEEGLALQADETDMVEEKPAEEVVEEQPAEVVEVVEEQPAEEPVVAEQTTVDEQIYTTAQATNAQGQPIIINVYNAPAAPVHEEKVEKEEEKEEIKEEEHHESHPTVEEVDGGIVFNEAKSITELYEELSNEQKSFFDELINCALEKPNAELSVTKNYESVKIGKKSILKLFIRRKVTVAEFMLENEALKEYRKHDKNKKGKAGIKVRPTVVAVTELSSLKTAIDMVNLVYGQLIEN